MLKQVKVRSARVLARDTHSASLVCVERRTQKHLLGKPTLNTFLGRLTAIFGSVRSVARTNFSESLRQDLPCLWQKLLLIAPSDCREVHPANQVLEARVGAQRLKPRTGSEANHVSIVSFVSFFQSVYGLFVLVTAAQGRPVLLTKMLEVRIVPGEPNSLWYGPKTSFTERSEDILYSFGPKGLFKGCRVFSSRSM